MPLPDVVRQPLQPGAALLPGGRAARARDPRRRRSSPGDRIANEVALGRPARPLPTHDAPGDPDARRQGHARPQARRRHPGRARPDPAHRSSSPACTTTSSARATNRRTDVLALEPVAGRRATSAARLQRAGGHAAVGARAAAPRRRQAAGADAQLRARVAWSTSSGVDFTGTGLYEHFRAVGDPHPRGPPDHRRARSRTSGRRSCSAGRKGDPLLTMERTSYDDEGRAVEYGRHLYRPDLYAFEMTLVDR